VSFLSQYTAHLITAIAIFAAIFTHWYWPKRFWLPCSWAAILSSATAAILFKFVPRAINGELLHEIPTILPIVGFAAVSSFVLAMLVGYLMKFAPSLF